MEEPNRHYKKRGGKKPFAIERRYTGPVHEYWPEYWERQREWSVYRRYKTEKNRDEALTTLKRKAETDTYKVLTWWEYRIESND